MVLSPRASSSESLVRFIASISTCTSHAALNAAFNEYYTGIGFSYAIVAEVRALATLPILEGHDYANGVLYDGIPEVWSSYYSKHNLARSDPALRYGLVARDPFSWYSVPQLSGIEKLQLRTMEDVYSMYRGWTVPVHGAQGALNLFFFSSNNNETVLNPVPMEMTIACVAMTEALREYYPRSYLLTDANTLSPKQVEVMSLMINEGNVTSTSKAMGISPKTVHKHLDAIKIKLGVDSVGGAMIMAVETGQVPFYLPTK